MANNTPKREKRAFLSKLLNILSCQRAEIFNIFSLFRSLELFVNSFSIEHFFCHTMFDDIGMVDDTSSKRWLLLMIMVIVVCGLSLVFMKFSWYSSLLDESWIFEKLFASLQLLVHNLNPIKRIYRRAETPFDDHTTLSQSLINFSMGF